MTKKKEASSYKQKISYAALFIFIAVALVVQVIVLFPLLLLNLSSMYALSPYGAISSVLSQVLMFLIFIGALGVTTQKFHGN
jgi:uncharacterized membrane protein (DUF373 family)